MKRSLIIALALLLAAFVNNSYSQTRIVFLPFQNMDGNMDLNVWCYRLQDSLAKSFQAKDPEGKYYKIIPSDSVRAIVKSLKLDPTSPQYQTDIWRVVEELKGQLVVSGNFLVKADRFLICAYIYDVETKLPNRDFQARDLFVAPENIYNVIPVITRRLFKYFAGEQN